MVSRFSAWLAAWLVVLVGSPFTAPLQSCDLSDLLPAAPGAQVPGKPSSEPRPIWHTHPLVDVLPVASHAVRTRVAAGHAVRSSARESVPVVGSHVNGQTNVRRAGPLSQSRSPILRI